MVDPLGRPLNLCKAIQGSQVCNKTEGPEEMFSCIAVLNRSEKEAVELRTPRPLLSPLLFPSGKKTTDWEQGTGIDSLPSLSVDIRESSLFRETAFCKVACEVLRKVAWYKSISATYVQSGDP